MASVEIPFGKTAIASVSPQGTDGNPGVLDGSGIQVSQSPNGALGFNSGGETSAPYTFHFTNNIASGETVTVTFTAKAQDGTSVTDSETVQADAQPVNQAAKLAVVWTVS